jgi:hypothetical protein
MRSLSSPKSEDQPSQSQNYMLHLRAQITTLRTILAQLETPLHTVPLSERSSSQPSSPHSLPGKLVIQDGFDQTVGDHVLRSRVAAVIKPSNHQSSCPGHQKSSHQSISMANDASRRINSQSQLGSIGCFHPTQNKLPASKARSADQVFCRHYHPRRSKAVSAFSLLRCA